MKANENLSSTVKTEVAATAKAEPAKTETAKTETVKKESAKKETVKKEPAKKTVKKTTAKKAESAKKAEPAKKAAKTNEKKTTTRKSNVKSEMFIQYDGNQVDSAALLERVQADCASEGVKVKELKLYIKPEDNACYYVANGNVAGKVDLY